MKENFLAAMIASFALGFAVAMAIASVAISMR